MQERLNPQEIKDAENREEKRNRDLAQRHEKRKQEAEELAAIREKRDKEAKRKRLYPSENS